ncbi:PAS domain S-box protein [Pelagerythrobacter rhizovicinus]|nr:PAS domain S-box protein [Pelagerythrobacter rhizovicinus]
MSRRDQDKFGVEGGLAFPFELFEATSDCVFVLDADWRFSYLNAKAIAELHAGDLLGTVIWRSFPAAVGSKFEDVYRRVAERRESETFEAYYPDPLNRWYEVHAVPYQDTIVAFFRNITKRRLAVRALLRRHNELDTVLGWAGVGIMQYAENHRLMVINKLFCEILGRTKEELNGLPMETFTHPDDIPRNAELLRKHRQAETPFHIKKRYVRPDGEIVWCSVAISFVRHRETKEPTTIVVARNIDEEVEAQRKAEETRALLRAVVDGADDLIYVKDAEGRFVLVNKKMAREFGIAIGQAGGDRFPDLAPRFTAEDEQVMTTDERLVIEEQIPTKSGAATFLTVKVPWQQNGATKGVIGISRDISERVRNEQALRESEERFRLAAAATGDAIWEWDLESGAIHWSSTAPGLTGEVPGGAIEWWNERVHPDDREATMSSLNAFVQSEGQRWEAEYRFLRPDNSYGVVADCAYLIRDGSGKVVRMIGSMSDITESVEAQARINRLQAELGHISRINAMGTMGSTLAHEINQPLASAGNYLTGLRRIVDGNAPDPASVRRGLEQAQAEISRAGEIIRKLRRLVEQGQAELHPIKLRICVDEALMLALPDTQVRKIGINVDVPSDMTVMADAIQLQQVLYNLIRNSVEAIAQTEIGRIEIQARDRENQVVVRVSDTGEGLQPEVKERLFSAFASTKPGGLGVGLSICRTIIEAHGGSIWAEDTGDEGATFAFTLPAGGEGRPVSPEVTG